MGEGCAYTLLLCVLVDFCPHTSKAQTHGSSQQLGMCSLFLQNKKYLWADELFADRHYLSKSEMFWST